jgi:hypothetical protein
MFEYHIKDSIHEVLIILDDDELLIQQLNVEMEGHHEIKNLNLVHFELMVKLFLSLKNI